MKVIWVASVLLGATLAPSYAQPSTQGDDQEDCSVGSRPEVTCTPLTVSLLESLEFASPDRVRETLGNDGRWIESNTLMYNGIAEKGNRDLGGIVNFVFGSERGNGPPGNSAQSIHFFNNKGDWIWSAENGSCSDFSGIPERCSPE